MTTHRSFSRAFLAFAGAFLTFASADRLRAQTHSPAKPAPTAPAAVDPATHAAHVAAGTHTARPAPDAAKGNPALNQQLSQLQEKVAQLEAALAKAAPPMVAAPAGAAPADAVMKMMAKMMETMARMMDKMMSMGSGDSIPAGAPAAGMNGDTGMGMDKMEMAGMMGMVTMDGGAPGTMPQSALPGFPGVSHLYHIGATGFFLDHPQHIALTTEQQAGLNKAKEQAALAKSTADRAVEQAEQELWTLTAADQPDATQVEAKIREIAKLRGDERLAFINAVGDASKLLTDEQRKSLTGFATPASAAPAAAPMAGGMKDM